MRFIQKRFHLSNEYSLDETKDSQGLVFDPRIGVPEYPGHPEIVGYLDT